MSILSSSQHNRQIFLECVLQYHSHSILPLQTDLQRFYVPVCTVVALQLLLLKQRYMCGSLESSFLLQKSPLVIFAYFAPLLLLWQGSCALNSSSWQRVWLWNFNLQKIVLRHLWTENCTCKTKRPHSTFQFAPSASANKVWRDTAGMVVVPSWCNELCVTMLSTPDSWRGLHSLSVMCKCSLADKPPIWLHVL